MVKNNMKEKNTKKEIKTSDLNKSAEEPKEETSKEEKITIDKKVLDGILVKLDMLEKVADKSRLGFWEEKHREPGLTIVLLSTYNGKVVLGWEKIIDEVFQDGNGVWHEKQIIKLQLEDGTSVDVNYIDSVRKIQKIEAEVKSSIKDEVQGTESLKVESKEGKEYTIDVRFVN